MKILDFFKGYLPLKENEGKFLEKITYEDFLLNKYIEFKNKKYVIIPPQTMMFVRHNGLRKNLEKIKEVEKKMYLRKFEDRFVLSLPDKEKLEYHTLTYEEENYGKEVKLRAFIHPDFSKIKKEIELYEVSQKLKNFK